MPTWIAVVLEIIKFTIPALIVFFTVYQLLKQYLDGQYRLRMMDFKQTQQNTAMPLRLQAYERMTLYCERINLPTLLLRNPNVGSTPAEMRYNLMMIIQNEFEFNVSQQVYLSPQLWEIIKLSKDDTLNSINIVYEKLSGSATNRSFNNALIRFYNERDASGPEKALMAIKKEVALLF